MIGSVVVLGLSAAINPILVGVVLVTLASPRPKALLGAYVAGGMTFSVGLGIGAVSLASGSGAVTSSTSATNGLVDLVLGLVLLAVAAWFATGRAERRHARKVAASAGRPKKPSAGDRLLGGSRTSMAFLAGVLLTLPSAMYLAALKDIAQAAVSTQEEILAILLFNVVMLLPALIPWHCSSSCRTRRWRLSSDPIAGCAITRSGSSRSSPVRSGSTWPARASSRWRADRG